MHKVNDLLQKYEVTTPIEYVFCKIFQLILCIVYLKLLIIICSNVQEGLTSMTLTNTFFNNTCLKIIFLSTVYVCRHYISFRIFTFQLLMKYKNRNISLTDKPHDYNHLQYILHPFMVSLRALSVVTE